MSSAVLLLSARFLLSDKFLLSARLPVIAIFNRAAVDNSQSTVWLSAIKDSGCAVKPEVNISGNTTISVGSSRFSSMAVSFLRLAAGSSQCKSDCTGVTLRMDGFELKLTALDAMLGSGKTLSPGIRYLCCRVVRL